jgi:signal transduction histidine kinase
MSSQPPTEPSPSQGAEMNLLIAGPVLGYLEAKFGREALGELADATGIDERRLLKPRGWVTHEELERVLAYAREQVGSDGAFLDACSYKMVESYGPLALVFRAGTVLMSYRVIAATLQFVSRISTYTLKESTHNSVTLEYRSERAESRLMCLSRQAQLPTVPLMFWKLPRARLTERKCIARGDDLCEYYVQWSEPLSWRWPLAGLVAGLALAIVARALGVEHLYSLPAVGALLGTTTAFRQMVTRANDFHTETTHRVGKLVKENEDAVEEVIKLHQRQEAFNALLGERIDARTSTLEAMVKELESKGHESDAVLRRATHDMRNPLQIALLNAQILTEEPDKEIADVGRVIFDSVVSVEAQMKRLLDIARRDARAFELHHQSLDVARFSDRVRRSLQALVIARDIRTSVLRTREAPETIVTDVMLFDRVIDNLISNAVKYTERGSIVAEVGGTPGHLTFKVSDTGRGIGAERLETVFVGGQRDESPLLGESHGIGLASAVRLLDELGGRLEVMSKPGVGTTIWAHVPIEPPERKAGLRKLDADEVLRRVVTIRSAANQ